MPHRDIVAVGTSAGGVNALRFLAERLPADLPAAVLVTIHLSSQHRSVLDEVLSRAGPLPASFAADGEAIVPGRIYLAPPDRHLIVEGDRVRHGHGPRENNVRPAIDPMLRSVAACCGGRAVGIVLTGTLADGASGLWALKQCGGLAVVQDPEDAAFPGMPQNALQVTEPDHVARLSDMPALIARLVGQEAGPRRAASDRVLLEVDIAMGGRSAMTEMHRIGERSYFTCPDCHGAMWEVREGEIVRFRCHVGHAYGAEMMAVAADESLRRALGSALRVLEERVVLARRLRDEASRRDHRRVAADWDERLRYYEGELAVLRDAVHRVQDLAAASVAE